MGFKLQFKPTKVGALLTLGTIGLISQSYFVAGAMFGLVSLHEIVGKPFLFLRWSFYSFLFRQIFRKKLMDAGDGREQKCFDFVKSKIEKSNLTGTERMQKILDAIDEFAMDESFLMNVGDEKGLILDEAVKNARPKVIVELGCYIGYSTIRMAKVSSNDCHIYTVEWSPLNAGVARQFFELAGVADKITVVEGSIGDGGKTVQALKSQYGLTEKVDFVFIDHSKDMYLPDLKTLMQEKLIHKGSVVVGDNILFPGVPDYKKFMEDEQGKLFKSKFHYTHVEYSMQRDLVLESTYMG